MASTPLAPADARRELLVARAEALEAGSAEAAVKDPPTSAASSGVVTQLRDELTATRTVLRVTREQYGAATEELQTVNNELKLKLDMVSRAHRDLQNLISATDVGTMFLDTSLRIQRFTPRVAYLFNIQGSDEGRPVTDFTHRLDYQDLVKDARCVLADLIPIERTVKTDADGWFLIRLRPYRTMEDKIDGVVVTFVDVTERRVSEAAWEKHQTMLLHELSHRVKNTLAVVQAVTHQTLRDSISSELLDTLELRLESLAKSHDLLVSGEWRGANLEALARQQLAPYIVHDSVHLSGPTVNLPPAIATPLGLVLHELATNAAKHGALKGPAGHIKLSWETRDLEVGVRVLLLNWAESGGPEVKQPSKSGAGSELIVHGLADAEVTREFRPEGLVCSIKVPLMTAGRMGRLAPTQAALR